MRCWKRFLMRWEQLKASEPWPRIEALGTRLPNHVPAAPPPWRGHHLRTVFCQWRSELREAPLWKAAAIRAKVCESCRELHHPHALSHAKRPEGFFAVRLGRRAI